MAAFKGYSKQNTALQLLVKSYTMGEINKFDYRRRRSDLIDIVTDFSGEIEEEEESNTQPYNSATGKFEYNVKDVRARRRFPDIKRHLNKDKVLLVATVLIAAYLTTLLFSNTDENQDNISQTASADTTTDSLSDPQLLVENFLQDQQWTDTQIDGFIKSWQELPATTRRNVKSAPWFYYFNEQIKKQYFEQKQLAEQGSNEAARNQLILLELATALNT